MQKHFVVAVAAALSVASAGVNTSLADREVVVQPGENLQAISNRYYADGDHAWEIAKYNHLANPDLIYAGLRLALPESPALFPSTDGTIVGSTDGWSTDIAPESAPSAGLARIGGTTSEVMVRPSRPPGIPGWPPSGAREAAVPNVDTAETAPVADPPAAVAQPAAIVPGRPIQSGLATWYGPGFNGNITYCGEVYDQSGYTAASNTLPCGTVIIVSNQNTGASVRVRVTDRGGFGGNVILDLSNAAFRSIAPISAGVIPVSVSLPGE